MREGKWQTSIGTGLKGKTLGLLGLGRLGAQVAAIGKAFGMEIIAWSQNLTAERAASAGARLVDKETLFTAADIVTIHLVLGERTRGLVKAADLARMKPSAYFAARRYPGSRALAPPDPSSRTPLYLAAALPP